MVWQSEIDELKHREHLAEQMGGPEGVTRQHERGKLTIRERIAALVDPGSFRQYGKLAGSATYENGKLKSFIPSNHVAGLCRLDGREVFIDGGDFTVRGGASESDTAGIDVGHGNPKPVDWRLPIVHLLDATGGSVVTFEKLGRTYIPDGDFWLPAARALNMVPVVAASLGSAAGGAAVMACIAHFSVMVKGISQIFPGGPPVVKAALGYGITKEDLGDYRIHTRISGVCDNVANTEEDAFKIIKCFLSYLPSNVWEMPPHVDIGDDPNRKDEKLLSVIPRSSRRGYDPYSILRGVLDRDSIFEIAPDYGKSRITVLARVGGYPVGAMINNPGHLGGSMDVAAGDKVIRLLLLCNTFHLPIVCFTDEPGFLVGIDSEKSGIERAGARLVCTTCETTVPWITFIIRQAYGVAGSLQYRPGNGIYRRYSWPSGNWGSIHIEGGASAAFRRVIESSADPEAKRLEIETRLKELASPFKTAEAIGLDIIDPRETRPLLFEFIELSQRITRTQLGPGSGPTYRP
ncbi:MAG: carboxyl transferase domain-containing protein [Dehalococcoidia bacterium]|nr:carboxyl transferase domain-containing protein [Dehalococcoidia bacterium]